MTAQALRRVGPSAAALALAALWPLSAYTVGPVLLPGVLLAAGVALLLAVRLDAGIAVILVLAPFTNAAASAGRPIRFIESGLAVGVLACALLVQRDQGALRLRTALPGFVLAFLAAAAISSLTAIDPGASLTRFLGVVAATATFFAVVVLCRTRQRLVMVAGAAAASLLLAGAHGVVQKVLGDTSFAGVVVDGEVVGRIAGSFSHPNQFAGYLICFIPLAGALAMTRSSSPRLRALCVAALCLSLPALAFSLTRGAILGLVLGSVVWVMLVRPRLALPLVAVIAVIGLTLAPGALQARLTDSTGGDLGLRSDLWQSALDIYATRPIDGVGLANFGEAYGRLPAQLSTGTQRRLLHQSQLLVPPHANNLPLTILAEEGLIGVIAFLGFMGAALWTCRKVALLEDPFARALGLGLGAGLCAMLVQSLLDFALFGEPSLPLYALMGCAAVLTASGSGSGALERHARAA